MFSETGFICVENRVKVSQRNYYAYNISFEISGNKMTLQASRIPRRERNIKVTTILIKLRALHLNYNWLPRLSNFSKREVTFAEAISDKVLSADQCIESCQDGSNNFSLGRNWTFLSSRTSTGDHRVCQLLYAIVYCWVKATRRPRSDRTAASCRGDRAATCTLQEVACTCVHPLRARLKWNRVPFAWDSGARETWKPKLRKFVSPTFKRNRAKIWLCKVPDWNYCGDRD